MDLSPILMKLAKDLAAEQAGKLGELALAPDKVLEGLKRMVSDGFLKQVTEATTIKDVLKAIKNVQLTSAGVLSVDGQLGAKTLDWLTIMKRCLGKLGRSPNDLDGKPMGEVEDDPQNPRLPREIRYFVEQLPRIIDGDADRLLQQAWENWSLISGMIATKAADPDLANVLVHTKVIDGASNVLADAHVGPPSRQRLELRFDGAENWNRVKFLGTATHEIGHLLGLTHSQNSGQLMGPTFNAGVVTPQEEDIRRAQAIWGAPPAQPTEPTQLGGEMFGDFGTA